MLKGSGCNRLTRHLLAQLSWQQDQVLHLGRGFAWRMRQQIHDSLSPPGWHLGHCAHTENIWLRRAGADDSTVPELPDSGTIFSTTGTELAHRAKRLPPVDELLSWVSNCLLHNRQRLLRLFQQQSGNTLLQGHFILRFLTEHAAQHRETLVMIASQRQRPAYCAQQTLAAATDRPQFATLPQADYSIGAATDSAAYDNEKSRHQRHLQAFKIATTVVSNAMWMGFMKAGGYSNDSLWSAAGRQHRDLHGWNMPGFWRRDRSGRLYAVYAAGAVELEPQAPVTGVSLYEAEAFAAWLGVRLPHEYEWETARKNGLLTDSGQVWEWCGNTLHPYPGFRAFPYQGYSAPYFGGHHYVLRGGSIHTAPALRRCSFRNFYTPEKRYLYSGVRLAADA